VDKTGKDMSLMEKRGGDWKSSQELIDVRPTESFPQKLRDMPVMYTWVEKRQAEE
jgi:hypothetical protein